MWIHHTSEAEEWSSTLFEWTNFLLRIMWLLSNYALWHKGERPREIKVWPLFPIFYWSDSRIKEEKAPECFGGFYNWSLSLNVFKVTFSHLKHKCNLLLAHKKLSEQTLPTILPSVYKSGQTQKRWDISGCIKTSNQ